MSCDPLIQSILLLGDGLASGSLLTQFEQLYRHKPESSMDSARLPQNIHKNRYRDIAPCKFSYRKLKYNIIKKLNILQSLLELFQIFLVISSSKKKLY